MKLKLTSLILITSIGLIGCSSAQKPHETTTQLERQYVSSVNQGTIITYVNQLSQVNVSLDESLLKYEQDLSSLGYTTERYKAYLTNNLLNAGLYSPKNNNGLSLNVLITKARIRGEIGAKHFSLVDGSDYLKAIVTITDKTGNVVASANIDTPTLKSCPVKKVADTSDVENNYTRNCGSNARISILNQYLADFTVDFIRGRFKD